MLPPLSEALIRESVAPAVPRVPSGNRWSQRTSRARFQNTSAVIAISRPLAAMTSSGRPCFQDTSGASTGTARVIPATGMKPLNRHALDHACKRRDRVGEVRAQPHELRAGAIAGGEEHPLQRTVGTGGNRPD